MQSKGGLDVLDGIDLRSALIVYFSIESIELLVDDYD